MSFVQTLPLWSGDPLAGIVVWDTGGIVLWTLLSALVGSFLGILREYDRCARRAQYEFRNRSRRVAHSFVGTRADAIGSTSTRMLATEKM